MPGDPLVQHIPRVQAEASLDLHCGGYPVERQSDIELDEAERLTRERRPDLWERYRAAQDSGRAGDREVDR